MKFRVLGPFEVVDEKLEVVPLGAAKERALLALPYSTPMRLCRPSE